MDKLLGLSADNLEWYQMMLRAVIVFVIALFFIRVAGMRTFGSRAAFDVVLNITIGAMLSRCITGHYPFFATLGTAALLALLHRLTAFIASRSRIARKLTEGTPVVVFSNGQRDQNEMRRQCINQSDLLRALHENNILSFEEVDTIWYETDGSLSVIKMK